MSITLRSAQTIGNGVKLRVNDTQYVTPTDPLSRLFELDASIYASGTTLLDISGNNRHATIHGSTSWNSNAGGCFVFNGNALDYIDVTGSDILSNAPANATFSVWANVAGNSNYQHIAGWRGGINFWFLILSGSSTTEARFDNGPSYDINIDYSSYYGTWALTTFVVNAAQSYTKLYINGTEVGSRSGMSGDFNFGNNLFSLGSRTDSGGMPMTGKIGGAVAYSKALTQEEVTAEYNRTKSRYGL